MGKNINMKGENNISFASFRAFYFNKFQFCYDYIFIKTNYFDILYIFNLLL
jgi:hypothetical protein